MLRLTWKTRGYFAEAVTRTYLQERCSKIFDQAYSKTRVQELFFLKKVSWCRPATSFKKRFMHRFFSAKFLNFFRTAFFSTPVNRCLWFNWILVSFDHHLRFTQMPENFMIVGFIENIWNFGVAMKWSGNRIGSSILRRKLCLWEIFTFVFLIFPSFLVS